MCQVVRRCNGAPSWERSGRPAICNVVAIRVHIPTQSTIGGSQHIRAPSFQCSHAFLKALPACKGRPDDVELEHKQTLVWKDGETVCIRILRRKNRQGGSGILRRVCSCSGGRHLCVVHSLWDTFFELLPNGAEPWRNITPGLTRERLRKALQILRVSDASKFGTHDFRRGHAEVTHSYTCPRCERVNDTCIDCRT